MAKLHFQIFFSDEGVVKRDTDDFKPALYLNNVRDGDVVDILPTRSLHYRFKMWWTIRYVSEDDVFPYTMFQSDDDYSKTLNYLIDECRFEVCEKVVRLYAKTFPITTGFILSKIDRFEPTSPLDTPEIH
jgi:hypothetical protein